MSNAVNALKLAVEFEKQALEKYNEAIPHVTNKQTREAVEKYASEKNEQIDSLHWMIMAEAGQLETEEAPVAEEAPAAETAPEEKPAAETKEEAPAAETKEEAPAAEIKKEDN